MSKSLSLLLSVCLIAGCASTRAPEAQNAESEGQKRHTGKVVGGAGGALAGGAMGYSSAGMLCTIGGPLCAIVVVPAVVVGGLIGLAAGSVVDAASERANRPREDTSAPPGESARAEAPPPPY